MTLAFAPVTTYAAGTGPLNTSVADVNNDGKLDLLVADYNGNIVAILLGNGSGGFGASVTYAVGTHPPMCRPRI